MTRIGIVGAGAIGTYAMERLAAHLCASPPASPLAVVVFEPSGQFGDGRAHDRRQPDTSYLNRVTSQVSFAADESNVGEHLILDAASRPTLYEWARRKFDETGDPRFDVRPEEYPRRYLHGLALAEAFAASVARLEGTGVVSVELRSCAVLDVRAAPRGGQIVLGTSDDATVAVDHLLLAMGSPLTSQGYPSRSAADHVAPDDRGRRRMTAAYPLVEALGRGPVPPGSKIGVRGMGPTGIDVLLFLTEGRGGRFEADGAGGRLRYAPSGDEPAMIHVFSRSGEFTSARAVNQKALDGSGRAHTSHAYAAEFLTHDAVAELRRRHGRAACLSHGEVLQIDFEKHVLPLLVLEMALVYYRTLLGASVTTRLAEAARPAVADFVRAPGEDHRAAIQWLLDVVEQHVDSLDADVVDEEHVRRVVTRWYGRENSPAGPALRSDLRFSWAACSAPVAARRGAFTGWHDALLDVMHDDLRAAAQGNIDNPVKAASDAVWRDLRPVLAEVVEFGGLMPASHARFTAYYWRLYSRMSNGLGLEAMQKVTALLDCGIVRADLGPRATATAADDGTWRLDAAEEDFTVTVSQVIDAQVPSVDLASAGGLLASLASAGLVRPWRNVSGDGSDEFVPGGIDVTVQNHPVAADGQVDERITVLGAPTEGPLLFQLAAARPYSDSAIINRCGSWARRVTDACRADPAAGVGAVVCARDRARR